MGMRSWLAGAALVLGAAASPALAAAPADDNWLPFEGCWRPADSTGTLVCVVGDAEGVRIVEIANGAITRDSRMVADGRARPVSQEGCSGSESVRWSAKGNRLYTSTQMTCGAQIPRNTTGMFALLSAREWVSIQAIAVDNEAATRVVRYTFVDAPANVPESIIAAHRENRLARETARMHAAAALTIEDVAEASKQVHGRAVEALLLERKQAFDLSGKKLLAMENAGLPSYVIDAMVAVTHPEQFAIREVRVTPTAETPARAYGMGSRYCDDLWYDRFDRSCYGYGYSRYSSSFFSPFNYYGGYGYYSTPRIIYLNGDDTPSVQHGSVTRRGYSNGSSTGSTGRSSSVASSPSRSSGSSSGSSSSSAGSSSSSSGSSSSRGTAKPRGGN